jgi:hypothetical protein
LEVDVAVEMERERIEWSAYSTLRLYLYWVMEGDVIVLLRERI